jgi:hypothetical protein
MYYDFLDSLYVFIRDFFFSLLHSKEVTNMGILVKLLGKVFSVGGF